MAELAAQFQQENLSVSDIRKSAAYEFLLDCKAFRNPLNLSDDGLAELLHELESFQAPRYMQEGFAIKFVGYDIENRPIWMSPIKNYPLKKIMDQKEEEVLMKYLWQLVYFLAKSIVAKTPEENPSRKCLFIADSDGMSVFTYLNTGVMAFLLKLVKEYKDLYNEILGLGILVNANQAGVWVFNLLRPLVGEAFSRVELYSKGQHKWLPRLQEFFPSEKVPTFNWSRQEYFNYY